MPRYVTVDPGVFFDQTVRPKYPEHSQLWRHFHYPDSPAGLLLWKSGEVKLVESFYEADYLTADAAILGGHLFFTEDDSWQAQVLENAGYTLIDYEGPVP